MGESKQQRHDANAGGAANDPFAGGGEAGARLRAIDWTAKPIGPVAGWPQSLRTALSICLASRHPICILWGPDRLYLYNDAYAPIVGSKHPWALGESYITVWPEIWDTVIRPILERVEATGEASWADDLLLVLHRHGFNEECYFAFSFAPIRVEDGSVGGVFTAITETTPQVVGERRLRTLRDLGVRAPAARSTEQACAISAEVLASNRLDVPFALFYLLDERAEQARLLEHIGLEPGTAAAPTVVSLRDGTDPWNFRSVVAQGQTTVHTDLEARFGPLHLGPWPEPVHTAVVLPIARPGETVPYGLLVCGVSPRRALDSDYQSFLGLVAGQVATAVANARAYAEERRRAEALAQLDRAKTEFFSNVSHEFRTPLTLMLGPLEDMLQRELASETREGLTVVHRNSLRLLKLVNSLLDFSRLEAGRIQANFAPVDLAALTGELASMFRAAIEKAGLRLIVACQPVREPAYVDRELWEKIVFNLLSNAYKFTERGEIVVALELQADAFELRVRDTGAGIAPEHQAEVFRRFHRVASRFSRTHEGTGIGLALVDELTRLHGGTVTLESTPGEGSTFIVRIPRGPAHLPPERVNVPAQLASTAIQARAFVEESLRWLPAATEEDDKPAVGENAARVLVADDNSDMRDYVRRLLRGRFEVRQAADGAVALEIARAWQPHLVLADVMMPRLDGFALVRELRADPRTKTVPIVLLSARAGEEARVEGVDAGADDYLTKPFSARELLARVESHVHLAELRREAAAQVSASEARFEQLVSIMPAGLIACDAEGRVIYANRRAAEIWRAAPRVGQSYEEFTAIFTVRRMDGTLVPTGERHMTLARRDGRSFANVELWIERPDGSRFLASCSISPTFDGRGRINGAINVFLDATEEWQAREALRETEGRYRAVFQQASVGIFECELGGRIVRTNPALSRIVGFTADELRRMNWRDLVAVDERSAGEDLAAQLRAGREESVRSERRCRRKDGSFGWVDVFATLILDATGRPARGLGIVVDITERKRAEAESRESEERFRLAADHAPVLIWMADRRQRCTWVNKPWRDFVGRTLEEERDRGWEDSVHPEDRAAFTGALARAAQTREPFTIEYRLRRRDGEYRWMLEQAVPRYANAEFLGFIGSSVDITDRRLSEKELERARDEAVAASRAKDDFLAALSHELRTPLSPVLLLASEAATDPSLPPKVREDFATVRKSIELEARLIDDLLDLTRITRNKLPLEMRRVDVDAVLGDALETVRAEFSAKRIELRREPGAPGARVQADPVRLQQVFWNILKNAVKFTPAGGRVSVRSRLEAPGRVCVEITDTGIGITTGELARVFEAFSQGDHASGSGSHRFGGLGLGLAISRRVIELHGGRIEAESAGRDRGATFRVELPVETVVAGRTEHAHDLRADPAPAGAAGPAAASPAILLVEDHGPTRQAIERLLLRRNYRVRAAATAAEARTLGREETFALLISDIGLPDGSGYDLMSEFGARGVRGIALTGYGMEEDVSRSRRAGFDVHLTKPVRMEALDRALASLLGEGSRV